MESGNAAVIRENIKTLKYFSPFINVNKLALESCGRSDDKSKDEIRKAVSELAGKTEEEISRQYCYDW